MGWMLQPSNRPKKTKRTANYDVYTAKKTRFFPKTYSCFTTVLTHTWQNPPQRSPHGLYTKKTNPAQHPNRRRTNTPLHPTLKKLLSPSLIRDIHHQHSQQQNYGVPPLSAHSNRGALLHNPNHPVQIKKTTPKNVSSTIQHPSHLRCATRAPIITHD